MHFHLGEIRGGRAVSVFQQTIVICQRRQNNCTDLGSEIYGLVGRSRRGVGCLVWKNKKELIKEAFTSGEEKRTCGVHVAVIIRLAVSD